MHRRTFIQVLGWLCGALMLPRRVMGKLAGMDSGVAAGNVPASAPASGGSLPPRVLTVHSARVSSWDYNGGNYLAGIDGEVVRQLLEEGLRALTDTPSSQLAWEKLLSPYRPGEQIVIKPNFNNTRIGYEEAIMTSPQLVAAVVSSLVEAGYPCSDLTVYDLTAGDNADIHSWLDPLGIQTVFGSDGSGLVGRLKTRLEWGLDAPDRHAEVAMERPVRDELGRQIGCFMPKVLTEASHLINLPVLKGHQFLLLSGPLKNHFGTVRFGNRFSYPVLLHGPGLPRHLVALNRHPQIRSKTRLIVADAILGAGCFTREGRGRSPEPWITLPQGRTPGSLVLGTDPVAVESVLGDLVATEQLAHGLEPYGHEHLHLAERAGLGIHDHADTSGRYARIEHRRLSL